MGRKIRIFLCILNTHDFTKKTEKYDHIFAIVFTNFDFRSCKFDRNKGDDLESRIEIFKI